MSRGMQYLVLRTRMTLWDVSAVLDDRSEGIGEGGV